MFQLCYGVQRIAVLSFPHQDKSPARDQEQTNACSQILERLGVYTRNSRTIVHVCFVSEAPFEYIIGWKTSSRKTDMAALCLPWIVQNSSLETNQIKTRISTSKVTISTFRLFPLKPLSVIEFGLSPCIAVALPLTNPKGHITQHPREKQRCHSI